MNKKETQCKWVRKPDNELQLQTSMWWVGCVKESQLEEGLFYWKVTTTPKSIRGYSFSEKEAVETVELLIKTDASYEYNIVKGADEIASL